MLALLGFVGITGFVLRRRAVVARRKAIVTRLTYDERAARARNGDPPWSEKDCDVAHATIEAFESEAEAATESVPEIADISDKQHLVARLRSGVRVRLVDELSPQHAAYLAALFTHALPRARVADDHDPATASPASTPAEGAPLDPRTADDDEDADADAATRAQRT